MNIIELELLSDDLQKTFQFYHQLLQFEKMHQSSSCITFEAGSSILTFRISKDENPRYHFAFNIPRNNIHKALEWAENKVEVIKAEDQNKIVDFVNWNAKAFYFYDNNENILELIARNDLEYETDEIFTAGSIMSISEIGIVTNDVHVTSEELKAQFSLDYFRTASPVKGFVPLGDDNGLFIVVETNRTWYLTDIPATKHWQRIIVKVNGKMRELINHNQ